MFRKILLLIITLGLSICGLCKEATPPNTFQQSKIIANKIFIIFPETIYSGCSFNLLQRIEYVSCGFAPNPNNLRDHRLEFEHLFPMAHAKHHFSCWNKSVCINSKGKEFKGRLCCREVDPKFNALEAELYNLQPEIGTVNKVRNAYKFTEFSNKEKRILKKYRNVPLYIDFKKKRVEPRDEVKGLVARANLFVAKKHNIRLSRQQLQLFNHWNKIYPPSKKEILWARQVAKVVGYENPFITRYNE